MTDLLQRFAAWLMNHVRLNRMEQGTQHGVPVFIKQRRVGSSIVIWFANRFLTLAKSGACMFVRSSEWMEWEVYCSSLLYPGRACSRIEQGQALGIAELKGASLRQLLRQNTSDCKPIVAAARELGRVHQIPCRFFRAGWSHGDMHLDNILYDQTTDQAVLIDFDTRHEFRIDQTWRHSDDLKVFLLELFTIPDDNWLALATAFVQEYRETGVLTELSRQLVVPRGFAGILWYTRTAGASFRRTKLRMERFRQHLCKITYRSVA